jgi:hypothetical protein
MVRKIYLTSARLEWGDVREGRLIPSGKCLLNGLELGKRFGYHKD